MSLYISTSRSITLFALLLDTKDRRLYSGSENLGIYYTEWFQLNNQVLMSGRMLGRVVGFNFTYEGPCFRYITSQFWLQLLRAVCYSLIME